MINNLFAMTVPLIHPLAVTSHLLAHFQWLIKAQEVHLDPLRAALDVKIKTYS